MIIQTTCNRFFRVRDAEADGLDHVWEGVEVKLVRGEYVAKAKARETLVRKAGARIVRAA